MYVCEFLFMYMLVRVCFGDMKGAAETKYKHKKPQKETEKSNDIWT